MYVENTERRSLLRRCKYTRWNNTKMDLKRNMCGEVQIEQLVQVLGFCQRVKKNLDTYNFLLSVSWNCHHRHHHHHHHHHVVLVVMVVFCLQTHKVRKVLVNSVLQNCNVNRDIPVDGA